MCNCVKAALNRGYIVRDSIYDEVKHDFVDTNTFYIPLGIKDEKGNIKTMKLKIHCCPICGDKLEVK